MLSVSRSFWIAALLTAVVCTAQVAASPDVKVKETPITGRLGWCISTYQVREETNASCGNMVDMTMQGLAIDETSIPITALGNGTDHEKRQVSLRNYVYDFASGKSTPNCTFFAIKPSEKTECCDGYDGNNCQTVVCYKSKGGCLNSGTCIRPNECKCSLNYLGDNCDEDLNAIKNEPNKQYCYSDDSCGIKKNGFGSTRVEVGPCCSDGLGSFGYQKGCMACKSGTVSKNGSAVEVVPFETCVSYGPNSYRTFDGLTYEYQGRCSYLLAGSTNPTMKWWIEIALLNCNKFETCRKQIAMRFDDINEYVAVGYNVQVLKLSSTGTTSLAANVTLEEHAEPNEFSGIKLERKGANVHLTVRSSGIRLKWDSQNSLFVTLERSIHKNQGLKGLCGDYNGDATNDFGTAPNPAAFGNQWKGQACQDIANVPIHCDTQDDEAEAQNDCRPISNLFFQCHSKVAPNPVLTRCVQDLCMLKKSGETSEKARSSVLCSHLSSYSYQCSIEGVCVDWRGSALCPQSCPGLMTWSECASACPTTCANYDQLKSATCHTNMVPRCRCGAALVHYKDTCIRPNECPCTYNSVEYMPGSNLVTDCSTCNCANGRWQCTYNTNCPKMCTITGSHINTFDGARYDFNPMNCVYSLLEPKATANDSRLQVRVTMESSPEYLLAVTADMQYVNLPKLVTVTYKGITIQLKSITLSTGTRPSVLINNQDVSNSLPYENPQDHILVRQLTSFYVMVQIGNHLTVYFDGFRTIELKGSKLLSQQVQGLCGNFDGKTENDLHSKGSDMIAPPVQVAVSYVVGSCKAALELPSPGSATDSLTGVDDCTQILLNSGAFKACRDSKKVDILGHYYRFCQKEKSCGAIPNTGELYCTAAMSAARACKAAGFQIDFSTDGKLSQCVPTCMSGGGSFTICARTCRSSCSDLSSTSICEVGCFPGCDCQYDNQYRDAYGTCVRQSECTCVDKYNQDGKIYRASNVVSRQCTNCTCTNGDFLCDDNSCADKVVCPKDQVFLDKVPACQKCENFDKCTTNYTESGRCGCSGDMVKKSDGSCVDKTHCPCIYLGTEYLPGHILKIGCKTYKCALRVWNKIDEDLTKCEAVCVAYGDPHYSTFDRKTYSFQGSCQYILMKSDANAALGLPAIEISAQNVPCGSQQVTCTKYVRAKVGADTYILVRGREKDTMPASMGYGMRSEVFTLFTQLVSDALGIRILWDRSTRVYIFLKPHFTGKVSGLCGNYDGNAENDFTIKNLPINNPIEFAGNFHTGGDSCASETSATSTTPQSWIEMCTVNSRRRDYAESVCGAIKSKTGVFSACQQVLEQDVIENYYENCMYDACGCDTGGDCECVCTVLAAFASTCTESGVSVRWRFQDQCPIMCPGGRVYVPCMPPCQKNCQNVGLEPEPHCVNSQCIEGCACPNGYVEYENECIPSDNCPCYHDGKEYLKGSVIHNTTSCTTCNCTKGGMMDCTTDELVCKPTKQPCTSNQYTCNSTGMCISYSQFCDGSVDCRDGDDEKNCNTTCSPSHFPCATTRQCIAMSQRCDGVPQCTDGTDEIPCGGCSPTEIQCNLTGKCISKKEECNGVYDCGLPDRSDEFNCTKCDPKLEFICGTALCVPLNLLCDGHDDCGDGSDEIGCTTTTQSTTTTESVKAKTEPLRCTDKDGLTDSSIISSNDISIRNASLEPATYALRSLENIRFTGSGFKISDSYVTAKDEFIQFEFNITGVDGSPSVIGLLQIAVTGPKQNIKGIELSAIRNDSTIEEVVKTANDTDTITGCLDDMIQCSGITGNGLTATRISIKFSFHNSMSLSIRIKMLGCYQLTTTTLSTTPTTTTPSTTTPSTTTPSTTTPTTTTPSTTTPSTTTPSTTTPSTTTPSTTTPSTTKPSTTTPSTTTPSTTTPPTTTPCVGNNVVCLNSQNNTICAPLCNGIVECRNGEDEPPTCSTPPPPTESTTTVIPRVCVPSETDGMASDTIIRNTDITVNSQVESQTPISNMRPATSDSFTFNTTGSQASVEISLTQGTETESKLTKLILVSSDFSFSSTSIILEYKRSNETGFTKLANLSTTDQHCYPDLLRCSLPVNSDPLIAQTIRITFNFSENSTTISFKLSVHGCFQKLTTTTSTTTPSTTTPSTTTPSTTTPSTTTPSTTTPSTTTPSSTTEGIQSKTTSSIQRCVEQDGMAQNGPISLDNINVSSNTQVGVEFLPSNFSNLRPNSSGVFNVNNAPSAGSYTDTIVFDFVVAGNDGSQSIIGKLTVIFSIPEKILSVELLNSSDDTSNFMSLKVASTPEEVAFCTADFIECASIGGLGLTTYRLRLNITFLNNNPENPLAMQVSMLGCYNTLTTTTTPSTTTPSTTTPSTTTPSTTTPSTTTPSTTTPSTIASTSAPEATPTCLMLEPTTPPLCLARGDCECLVSRIEVSKDLRLNLYTGDLWVEIDSTLGLSHPTEPVNEGDLIESGVSVKIACGECNCRNGALRCTKGNCSNDCQWNQWQPWGSCTATCDTGVRYRNRTVASPARFGGEQCHSKDFQDFELCSTQSCPCVWSLWSAWSDCSQPCSSGVKSRTRTPQGECQLDDVTTETALCNVQPCGSTTVSPTCSEGKMVRQCNTVSCPYTCGHVTNETCSDILSCTTGCFCAQGQVFDETARSCVTPDKCTCDLTALRCGLCSQGQCINGIATCVPTANCDCTWGPWSDWEPCSKACDGGTQTRTRSQATSRRGTGTTCTDGPTESQLCNTDRCPGCKDRFGNIVPPGDAMPAENNCEICYCSYFTNQRECIPKAPGDASNPAPQWSEWSDFSACSAPCGTGTRRRNRICLSNCANDTRTCTPDESGRMNEDQQSCNRQDCLPPVDCQVSDWTNGPCYAQCNGNNPTATGQQLRIRQITQLAANCGMTCPATYEIATCTKPCSVDCLVGQWSAWSEPVKNCVGSICNPSCGIGERQRTRPVLRPAANDGQACQDREFQPTPMPCNETTCTGPETVISCATKCWRTCEDVRANKQCQDPECVQGCGCAVDKVREGDSCVAIAACSCTNPSNASQLMPPGTVIQKDCNKCTCTNGQFVCETKSCAVDCVWSTWQKVGVCNVTCGTGKQQWNRSIATPASSGGADCTGPTSKITDCFGDEGPCCNPNDTYVDTGRCENTCAQLLQPGSPQPKSNCQPSCQCKPGSVREASGKCVSLLDCFSCMVDGVEWPNGRVEVNRANCSRRYCLHGQVTTTPLTVTEMPPCTQADEAAAALPGGERVVDEGNCCYRAALRSCAKGSTLIREAHQPDGRICHLVTPLSIERCTGACPGSSSVYVTEQGAIMTTSTPGAGIKVMGECSCCNPTGYTAKPAISVSCADGTGMQLTLYSIDGCACSASERKP